MEYTTLSQAEQDDILVEYLMAQERDLFCHSTNLARFNAMLATLPAGKFKDRISDLRNETEYRLTEVQAIVDQTLPQLPTKARIDAALTRLKQKQGTVSP